MSTFQNIARIFENVKTASLIKHQLSLRQISKLLTTSSRLFKQLDRADPVEAEFGRQLWVLRSQVLFTLLRFDDPALELQTKIHELRKAGAGLLEASADIASIGDSINALFARGDNPKRKLFEDLLTSLEGQVDRPVGIFVSLSAGRAPGWPAEAAKEILRIAPQLKLISSKRELRSETFRSIILPCGCAQSNPAFLEEVFHTGRAPRIDALLYEGERISVPKRRALPGDRFLESRTMPTRIDVETRESGDSTNDSREEGWVNEAFWQGIHGAERIGAAHCIKAHFVLFADATGAFIPADKRVTSLQDASAGHEERELLQTEITEVTEGDLVILRAGGSEFLLDEASEHLAGDANLLDDATAWKVPLEALLITQGFADVAGEMALLGAPVTAQSVKQWAGPDVLGPGREQHFRVLMEVLARRGKLDGLCMDVRSYSDEMWNRLQRLRGIRQQAGNAVRQELFKALVEKYGDGHISLGERTSVHLLGDTSQELLILKVSCVDQTPAYVPSSKLFQIDDLRGNKWLG